MERISSSDALGHFTIRNLKAGCQYRIFVLKESNRNYIFDDATENIAFLDTVYTPYAESKLYADTLFTYSLTVDTIIYIDYNDFYPNDVLLMAFNEQKKSRYMEDKSRKTRNKLDFIFSTPHDSLPTITPLNFEADSNWYVLEKNLTNDTLSYWIRDSLIFNNDTLMVALQYYRTDTLSNLTLYDDTLTMTYRAPKESKSKKKKKPQNENDSVPSVIPTVFAEMNINATSSHDVNKPVIIQFNTPLDSISYIAFHLLEKCDTVWIDVPDSAYNLVPDSTKSRTYLLTHKWKAEGEYKIVADSMAAFDMYGLHTNKSEKSIKVKSMQSYSNLYFAITSVSDSAVVQLLDGSDKPVANAPVIDGGAEFTYLKPGTYFARLYIDSNNNGKYDTGNYAQKLQPEEVYYYPQSLELRAFWNVEQSWDIYQVAIDMQKPNEIKKNKPKEKKKEEKEDQHTDSHNHYGSNSPFGNTQSGYGSNPNTPIRR